MNKPINIQSFVCEISKCPDIQRLKAENEELKAFKRECLKPVYLPDIEPEVINKYKQALEEVKDYCEQTIYMPLERQFIIHKINEVLKDERTIKIS